jgi:hypothetical protein
MNRVDLRKAMILLSVTFIFFCFSGEEIFAGILTDSADVAIYYKSVYPGHFGEVEVWLKSPVQIAGFQFIINLSNPELFNFHTDSITIEDVLMRIDTCTWEPDSLHDSTCFKDSTVKVPVRNCFIDTVGSLISNFSMVECHGDTADTSKPDCKWIRPFGMAKYNYPIAPNPNYQRLFKFGVNAFCIPDTVTDRTVNFYMFPQSNSFLSDPHGNVVPFRYHMGQYMTWYSVPGDANADSALNVGDVAFMINYLFRSGPRPCIPESADPNGSCLPEVGDITTMINYLFRHGPAPVPGCWYGK